MLTYFIIKTDTYAFSKASCIDMPLLFTPTLKYVSQNLVLCLYPHVIIVDIGICFTITSVFSPICYSEPKLESVEYLCDIILY